MDLIKNDIATSDLTKPPPVIETPTAADMRAAALKSQNREEDDILTRDCRELYGANYIVETYNELTTKAKADLDTAASKREARASYYSDMKYRTRCTLFALSHVCSI